MSWDGLNRRKFLRVVYPCLIKFTANDQKKEMILTHTENIGIGGACVTIKKELKLFAEVEIEIDLLDSNDHIKTVGKVVWVVRRKALEAHKPLFYDVGVEFKDIPQKQKEHLIETMALVIKNGAVVLRTTY